VGRRESGNQPTLGTNIKTNTDQHRQTLTKAKPKTQTQQQPQGADASRVSASLLSCFGDLFSARLAPEWPSDLDQAAAAASGAPPPGPRAAVSLQTNDVTRARVELESAAFESSLAPRAAARLLHAFAGAVAAKFFGATGKRLAWFEALFFHLEEYLTKDSLDLFVSLRARAEAAAGEKLRMHIGGLGAGGGSSGGGWGSSSGGGRRGEGASSSAVHLVNDVDLLTVLNTVQLLASVG
jgi:hypothetical protein